MRELKNNEMTVMTSFCYNDIEMDRTDSDFDFIFITISFLAQNEIQTKIFLKVLSVLSICMS